MAVSMIEFLGVIFFGLGPVVVLILMGLFFVLGGLGGGGGNHPDRF
jgi:hypothetical protein